MKFLCVKCDSAMVLHGTEFHSDIRSHSVLYQCAKCSHQIAMLTNSHESQIIASLGVKIGPPSADAAQPSKCPFANMVAGSMPSSSDSTGTPGAEFSWTGEAATRLGKIPEFMRPMAKQGIESFARERGLKEISAETLDKARAHFGI